MWAVTTTGFTTHSWRNGWIESCWWLFALLLFWCLSGPLHAQSSVEMVAFQVEREDDDVLVNAQVQFELTPTVEDALLKGIPVYFVAEAELFRERWYWYDKRLATTQRHMRLAYQPLTRRWRLNVSAASGRETNLGLALNQTYETLAQALSAIKRVNAWKLADATELESGQKYRVEFRFRLDLSQLPRPFQIGAIGQSDWDLAVVANTMWQMPAQK